MQGSTASAALSSDLTELLRDLGLQPLALTFATEQISLTDLRRMAQDRERFEDDMRAMNVQLDQINKLFDAVCGDHADPLSCGPVIDEASGSAVAALAAMAKSQAAALDSATINVDDLLASALGRVASIGPPAAVTYTTAASDDEQLPHFSQTNLSYDSWQQLAKNGGKAAPGVKANAALLAYQRRGQANIEPEEKPDYGLPKQLQTSLVVVDEAKAQRKLDAKGWFV